MPFDKQKIDLMWLMQPAIIIICKTGFVYTNQTGGYGCNHSEIEGSLMPVCGGISSELENHFCGKWNGWCNDGIDEATAKFIDSLLTECSWLVDRNKLKESQEAWIFVNDTVTEMRGILTWMNSD